MHALHALSLVLALGAGFALGLNTKGEYRDPTHDFRIQPPGYEPAKDQPVSSAVVLYAPPHDGFQANINIQIQRPAGGLEEFKKQSLDGFERFGFEVLSEKNFQLQEKPAIEWVYQGSIRGRELQFLSWSVARDERIYLITCTALKESFKEQESKFRDALATFELL